MCVSVCVCVCVLLERRATHFLCWAAGSSRRSRHASACRGRSSGCPTRSRPARADAVRTTCSDSAPRDQDVSSTWCTSLSRPWIRLTTGPFVTLCQPASATNTDALESKFEHWRVGPRARIAGLAWCVCVLLRFHKRPVGCLFMLSKYIQKLDRESGRAFQTSLLKTYLFARY